MKNTKYTLVCDTDQSVPLLGRTRARKVALKDKKVTQKQEKKHKKRVTQTKKVPEKSTDLTVPVLDMPRPQSKLATPLGRVLCFGWFGRWTWGTLPDD